MHVNNYFIESLVLCFSCGCDKNNLNYEHIENSSTVTECSMNTAARMIIGKQIHWSNTVGDQCDNDGPVHIDLEPLKTVIQLIVKQTPECSKPPEKCGPGDPNCAPNLINPGVPVWPIIPEPPRPTSRPEGCRPDDPFCPWRPPTTRPPWIIYETTEKPGCPPNDPYCYWRQTVKTPGCYPGDPFCQEPPTTRPPPCYPGDPFCSDPPTTRPPPCYPGDPFCSDPPTRPPVTWTPYEATERPRCTLGDPFCAPVVTEPPEPWITVRTEHGIDSCPPDDPFCTGTTPHPPPEMCYPGNPFCQPITTPRPTTTVEPTPEMCYPGNPFCQPITTPRPTTTVEPTPGDCQDCEPHTINPQVPVWTTTTAPTTTVQPTSTFPPPALVFEGIIIIVFEDDKPSKCPARKYEPSGLEKWMMKNPTGHIFIVIVGGELKEENWQEKLQIILSKTNVIIPSYIILVDWSKYLNMDFVVNAGYIKIVGGELGKWIHSMPIPLSRLTIIGFGSSAHVAGFTGKYLQESHNSTIYRIIGLNPTGNVFTESTSTSEKLSPTDALQVLVIHTETSSLGYCCATGTVDVIVNDPSIPQPWCKGEDEIECSHSSAIEILMIAITKGPLLVRKEQSSEVLFGFPLQIDLHINGVYHLITETIEEPPIVPPHEWEKESDGFTYGRVDETLANNYKVSQVKIYGMLSTDDQQREFQLEQGGFSFEAMLEEHPLSEIILIITEEHYTDWAIKLRTKLFTSPVPVYVAIVDWSSCVYPSYRFTSSYALKVADAVSNWIQQVGIPGQRLEIVGFGTSAHVAGVIGTHLQSTGNTVHRIVGLDPITYGWSDPQQIKKISSQSGNVVQVIHTNTKHYGYLSPLGHYDIYPNGGAWQPYCQYDESTINECSHRAAITYYIASIDILTMAMEAEITLEGIAVISGEEHIRFGYWLSPDATITARVFVLITRPNEMDTLIPTLYHENSSNPDPERGLIWPKYEPHQLYQPEIITRLILHIYFSEGSSTKKLVLWINGRFTFNIINLKNIIEQKSGMNMESYYMIINGERDMDTAWADHMKDVIISTRPKKSLVMVADWSHYKHKSYILTSRFVRPIAQKLAEYVVQVGLTLDKLHVIGFSMGAHMAGILGNELISYSFKLDRITGLDPAKYMWYHPDVTISHALDASDADFVDVYHTNARDLGYPSPLGVVDYYINGGIFQPGCLDAEDDCSHMRSIEYFIESFRVQALAVRVEYQPEATLIFLEIPEFITFGYYVELGRSGTYYIKTQADPPYLTPPPGRNPGTESSHGSMTEEGAVGGGGVVSGSSTKVIVPGKSMRTHKEEHIILHRQGPTKVESHHKIVVLPAEAV